MAVVWEARRCGSETFAPLVAIKRLRPGRDGPQEVRFFEQEARLTASFSHPNVCRCIDFGVDEKGRHFMVMEHVHGLDMTRYLKLHARSGQRTAWPIVVDTARQVLAALREVHTGSERVVVHRDISPHNIRLGLSGGVKLLDFGLARPSDRARETPPHFLKGKISYTAPELTFGAEASVASDLYGVGIVLWESLALSRLFNAPTDVRAFRLAQGARIPPLHILREDLPKSLYEVINKSLAADPAARFQNASEMWAALTDVIETEGAKVDPRTRARHIAEVMSWADTPPPSERPRPAQVIPLTQAKPLHRSLPPSLPPTLSRASLPPIPKPTAVPKFGGEATTSKPKRKGPPSLPSRTRRSSGAAIPLTRRVRRRRRTSLGLSKIKKD